MTSVRIFRIKRLAVDPSTHKEYLGRASRGGFRGFSEREQLQEATVFFLGTVEFTKTMLG